MPPAVIAAGIGAAGALGGAALSSHAASNATDAQAKAAADALAFEREKEAERKAEYDKQQAALQAQWDARQAMLAPYRAVAAGILGRYGFKGGIPAPTTMPVGWDPKASGVPAAPPIAQLPGADTLMAPPAQDGAPIVPARPTNLADLSRSYQDWRLQ